MVFLLWIPSQAQEYEHVELRDLVDSPTAGLLAKWNYAVDLCLFPEGGVLAKVSFGLLSRLTVGLSYGGLKIIGEGEVDWNPRMAFQGKLRIVDESFVLPAVAFGFDSQGYGTYTDTLERYQIKSKGIYAVLSKSFWMLGPLGFHAGANYSLEEKDGDSDLSFFAGLDKDLVAGFVLLADYDLATNDDDGDGSFGAGNGYLNAGLRWTFADKLSIEFDFKNLVDNREDAPHVSREIRIIYWNHF
jgi:outer membrane receptor protein involved in Fe transport